MTKKITFLTKLLLILILSTGVQTYASKIGKDDTLKKAYEENLISKEQYIVYQFQRMLQPDQVPVQFRKQNTATKQDLTILFREAKLNWGNFSQETKEFLSFIYLRPTDASYMVDVSSTETIDYAYDDTCTVYSYSTDHFKIHYVKYTTHAPTLTDANNNGHPDYVETMGSTFENVYTHEITTMGYEAPPSDGTEGGDSKFDVYINNIDIKGLYGWAQSDDPSTGSSVYSFMVMDNDYSAFASHTPTENMQITAAHEFHHSVQMGYNYDVDGWYMETTSVWMEDEVYDAINDNHQFMKEWFDAPETSLDIDDGDGTHEYGSWIFNKYLSEKFDAGLIKNIWDRIKTQDVLPAIENALAEKSTDLRTEFTNFAGWNYDKTKYSEGAQYPNIKIENASTPHNTYPLDKQTTTIDNLASKYYKFLPDPSKSGKNVDLMILFDGPDFVACGAVLVTVKGGVKEQHIINIDAENKGSFTIDNFGGSGADSAILVMCNASQATDGASFSYEAKYAGVDVALVLDRSGSMSTYGYINPAKEAASNFVALMQNGDQVAVASFSTYSTVNFPLTYIDTVTVKQEAQSAISGIYASGSTSIGSGIIAGQTELTKNTTQATQGMVLLSDGFENSSPYAADVLPNVPDNIDVYTIALGANSDQQLLNNIATSTGGFFSYAPDASGLIGIYNTIHAKVTNQQNVSSRSGIISQGETKSEKTVVDRTMRQVSFSLSFRQNSLGLKLKTPGGETVDSTAASTDPKITYSRGSSFLFFNVEEPETGEWEMMIEGKDVTDTSEVYYASVSGDSDLEVDLGFNKSEYGTNDPILITAKISENEDNIIGASIEAFIEKPTSIMAVKSLNTRLSAENINDLPPRSFASDGQLMANSISEPAYDTTITLFDDGNHRDGLAGDGVYANFYTAADIEGSYNIRIEASKETNGTKEFERESAKSTYVQYNDNSQPFLISPTQIKIRKGRFLTYTAQALNFDGDSLAYSFEGLPAWLSVQDSIIAGRVPKNEPENLIYFTVKVTDSVNTDSMQVGLVMKEAVETEIIEKPENNFYNAPNPFMENTNFVFELTNPSLVKITVYNAQGQSIGTIHSEHHPLGQYSINWDARGLNKGVYFVKIETNTFQKTIRTVLLQ